MKILGLEFSSPQRSVALLDTESDPAWTPVRAASTRDEPPLTLIQSVLDQAGLNPEGVDGLAIGVGPGSYTGIRSAIALAQGWQLGRDTPLYGISSALCLAHEALIQLPPGPIHLAIDAQRSEFYVATYHLRGTVLKATSALALGPASQVRDLLAQGKTVVGPGLQDRFPEATSLNPTAFTLCQLAQAESAPCPGEKLEPIYLRPVSFVKAPPSRTW